MSRTKGSKNKPKHDFLSLSNNNAGNPAFNIKEAKPSETIGKNIAPGAILPEDMELERSLQSMTTHADPVFDVIGDEDPTVGVVKKTIEKREMLN